MTREEILKADEETLQKRWVKLMNHPLTYSPGKNAMNQEYLLIGAQINLLRGQHEEAIKYSDELMKRYNIALKED